VAAQRFRVLFRKGERVRYISHLDVLRYWERCIRRAELPLAYSQGFTPHPKIAFAGPLALGFTAEAEVLDVTLDERLPVLEFEQRLREQTSPDLPVVSVLEIPLSTPPPQAAVLWADYAIDLPALAPADALATARQFLALTSFEWTEERKERERVIDLRAAVVSLRAEPLDGGTRLHARLSASQEQTVRPETLIAALFPGVEPTLICRRRLVFEERSPAHEAWRRKGRFES
jgi:radical SAM-linked protein